MLLRTPGYSFFHSSAWARVLSESYGYTPFYFTIIEDGKFRALVPIMEVNSFLTGKRGVSLPFSDYCEPIVENGIVFDDLFNSMTEFGKQRAWKYIELRGGSKYVSSLQPPTSNLVPCVSGLQPPTSTLVRSSSSPAPCTLHLEPVPKVPCTLGRTPISPSLAPYALRPVPFCSYLGHTLDLTAGEEKIFSNFRDSTRRNIKKAINQGVEIRVSSDLKAVKEFCRLNSLTRKEHGLPPQPYHFFQKVFEYVLSKGLGFVVLASRDDQNIAGAVFFIVGDKAIYKYGASDKRYQELRANNLVMWEALKWFGDKGCKIFCFGRTEEENEGLQQFKAGWGPQEHQIQYFKYVLTEEAFILCKRRGTAIYTGVFRRLPIPMLNIVGSFLYRHMG